MGTIYGSVGVDDIKTLLLFDVNNYKYEDGSRILSDAIIEAHISLAEQEVYSYCLQNDIKPATNTKDHIILVIKKLAVCRIKNLLIEHGLLNTNAKIEDPEQLLETNLKFLIPERRKKQVENIILPEETMTIRNFDIYRSLWG